MQTSYAIDHSDRLVSPALSDMDRLVEIRNDVFDIASRLREVDGDYYPVYNVTKKRFEIHHRGRAKSLQLVLPYDSLDCRAVQRARKTRREWVENMLRDMDKQNAKLERDRDSKFVENAIGGSICR